MNGDLSKKNGPEIKKRNFYPVPACAWKRELGHVPDSCASSSPVRGVVLGGFGTGAFMYNIEGTFGPWQSLDNALYKGIYYDDAAFHIYEKTGSDKPIVRCLSTALLSGKKWHKLGKKEADYFALQPKGWVTYNCFQNDISMKFFSPIIPDDYKLSSAPVAVWEFKISNPQKVHSSVSIMFTFPSVFIGAFNIEDNFKNYFKQKKDIKALVLRSKNKRGEWCLAAREGDEASVSYISSWNTHADGRELWQDFQEDGKLNNTVCDPSHKGAALCVSTELAPGETKYIPFILSWDFPLVKFGQGREWYKKYCEYYNPRGNNSFTIACEALVHYPEWEDKIDAWMNPVINNEKYPDWLKCAAFNELYYSQFGGIFYSSGPKKKLVQKNRNLSLSGNPFFEMECMLYPFCNTFDVRYYSSLPYVRFWPEIEKELLLDFSRTILDNEKNNFQTPHDSGNPYADPFVKTDDYGTNFLFWKDLAPKFILQCWRYYYLYHDEQFLKKVWPACKKTYEYMKSTDKNKDYLPDNNGSDNTYDAWGLFGTSLLCGGLWVAALQAMEKISGQFRDNMCREIRTWITEAKKNLDLQLWDDKDQYYHIDTDGSFSRAIMSDGLNGQLYCDACGLDSILPADKMKKHYRMIYEKCVRNMTDYDGDGYGDVGALNGINPDGTFIGINQSDEIWAGSTYYLAAGMYRAGLREEALQTAYGIYYTCYRNESTAYWFNTPEAWDKNGKHPRPGNPEQYQRARAVWELLLAIDDPYKKVN